MFIFYFYHVFLCSLYLLTLQLHFEFSMNLLCQKFKRYSTQVQCDFCNKWKQRSYKNVGECIRTFYRRLWISFFQNQTRWSFREHYTRTKVRYFSSYSVLFITICPKYNAGLVLLQIQRFFQRKVKSMCVCISKPQPETNLCTCCVLFWTKHNTGRTGTEEICV